MRITVYDKDTGKILKKMIGGDQITRYIAKNEDYIVGDFPEDGKIINKKFVPKKYPYPKYKIPSAFQAYQYAEQGRDVVLKALQNIMSKQEAENYIQEHYKEFRARVYPERAEFLDAQVKIDLGNAEQKKEGEQQLQDYYKNCMKVKKEFPKKYLDKKEKIS